MELTIKILNRLKCRSRRLRYLKLQIKDTSHLERRHNGTDYKNTQSLYDFQTRNMIRFFNIEMGHSGVARLQIEPELICGSKVAHQPKRSVCRNNVDTTC